MNGAVDMAVEFAGGPEVIRTKGELKCCQWFTAVERMNT